MNRLPIAHNQSEDTGYMIAFAFSFPWEWVIASEERRVAVPLDYLRTLARSSPSAFMRLGGLRPMGWYRRAASAEAYATARLTADRMEDCGSCLQIAVNLALRDGADAHILRAVLDGDRAALPEHLTAVLDWTEAVLTRGADADRLGLLVEDLAGGQAARAELAIAIGVGRIFPTMKRALGHGGACVPVGLPHGREDESPFPH